MSSQLPIFESKATYYNSTAKKWVSGTFTLNDTKLQFQPDDNKVENLRLPLSTICSLEKRQSSFIYAALVVTVGSEKHWFASFENRDTVYNLLELFWRQSLIGVTSKRTPPNPKSGSSALGKELLGILHESECTLVEAANTLSAQGRQLQESQMVMEDINTDLTIAQKVLQKMNWRFQTVFTGIKTKVEKTSVEEEPRQKHFKVTFTFAKTDNSSNWEQGTLVVADNLFLLDEHKNKRLTVNYVEVEKFEILSPWEFCLTYSMSWVSKDCYFMCPQLSTLLKFLNTFPSLKKKIILNEDEAVPSLKSASDSEATTSKTSPSTPSSAIPIVAFDKTPDSSDTKEEQAQMLTEDSLISDEDMLQISNVLNNLQTLATEVSREQQNQMEKINSLIVDVDKTELRITEQNNVIKKTL